MIHHIHMVIDTALSLSDNELQMLFEGNPTDIRIELKTRRLKGEKLIGSEGCEGFDPVTGCPGHPKEESEVQNG